VKRIFFLSILSLFFLANMLLFTSIAFSDPSEDKALDELAQKMLSDTDKLKGKRIGLFKFTSIEGKETPNGARVSDSLLERLIGKSSLKFIDRTELKKIIAENELEQTGLIDTSLVNESGKILPIDLMITGTFAQINTEVTISARVVNAKTGELAMVKSCRYNSMQAGGSTDSAEAIALFKKSPDTMDELNRVYLNLKKMSERAPLVFLIVTMDKSEIAGLEKKNIRLSEAVHNRIKMMQNESPEIRKKISNLRKGLAVMKESFPTRYNELMVKKSEVINYPPGGGRGGRK
jgi:hypothetical protein